MGLISHAAAVGFGYALARPEGRRQLLNLRDQARRLLQHPQVTRWQDAGRELATQQAVAATKAVKDKLGQVQTREPSAPSAADSAGTVEPSSSRHAADDHPQNDSPTDETGFGGTTVEEDSKAAILGLPPLPRLDPSTPPSTSPLAKPGQDKPVRRE